MRVLGIIAEYNPFHNGHLYHLEKSMEITGSTHSMAIMSGHFLQRGEPAIVNKWARAEMAVAAGVDLVIELPVVYSCRSAEAFALGALSILDRTNVVDCICFGSEWGKLGYLEYIANILHEEPLPFKKMLKHNLEKGLSFPAARARALETYVEANTGSFLKIQHRPNNILAVEYLKALRKLNSSIQPFTIKRIKAEYDSTVIRGSIASATAIRKAILESRDYLDHISSVVPPTTMDILKRELLHGRGPVYEDLFSTAVISYLRKQSPRDLTKFPEVAEGLEYKFWEAARKSAKLSQLVKEVKSKRYTLTRLKRISVYLLLEIYDALLSDLSDSGFPGYVRVLAFNKRGREILKRMNALTSIPIIIKAARHPFAQEDLAYQIFQKDTLATDLFVLSFKNSKYAISGQDYLTSPILKDY